MLERALDPSTKTRKQATILQQFEQRENECLWNNKDGFAENGLFTSIKHHYLKKNAWVFSCMH